MAATRTSKNSSRLLAEMDKKLQPLQQRIALVLGLFEHTPVEREPGSIAIEEILRIVERDASHGWTLTALIPRWWLLSEIRSVPNSDEASGTSV